MKTVQAQVKDGILQNLQLHYGWKISPEDSVMVFDTLLVIQRYNRKDDEDNCRYFITTTTSTGKRL